MRFATTPARVKGFAGHLRRALPALSHSACLDVVSRAAGFRDWHELQSSNGSTVGPALPLRLEDFFDTYGFSGHKDVDQLMAQLLEGLKGHGEAPLFFVDKTSDTTVRQMTANLLFWTGLAVTADEYRTPHKWVADAPAGSSVFYELARTSAFERALTAPNAAMDDYQGGHIFEIAVGPRGALPQHVEDWLTASRASVAAKAELRRLLGEPPAPLSFGSGQITRAARLVLIASDGLSVQGLVCADIELAAQKEQNLAVLCVRVSGLLDEGVEQLEFAFGSAISTEVEADWVEYLIWAMFGAPDARLEVHLGLRRLGRAGLSKGMREAADTAACLLYDSDSCGHHWQKSLSAPGIHFYCGPGVESLNSDSGRRLPTHRSKLFA